MSTIVKSMILGLGLAAGIGVGAHAQTAPVTPAPHPAAPYPAASYESIAALPPAAVTVAPAPPAAAPVAPAAAVTIPMHGPEPGKGWYPSEKQTRAVERSPEWVGPRPH